MSLPILTTVEDLRGLVEYLKNKPTGATVSEARAAVRKQILDGRKIAAYVFWQFVTKDGERLKLSPGGWELVRKTKPEPQIFRETLDGCTPYRSVLVLPLAVIRLRRTSRRVTARTRGKISGSP